MPCKLTRLGFINAYLVRESDSWTVLDTTLPGLGKPIAKAAQDRGLPIGRVLLTHAHGDHVGSLDELASEPGHADVAISGRDARLLAKKPAQDRSLDPGEPPCKLKGGFPGQNTKPTHLVNDGELFGSLRCLATPGHTPGHFSFLDERDGTLYTGDALVTMGGSVHVVGFGPWFFPLPSFATWHRPLALESARRLLETVGPAIRRYCAGHGRVVEGGAELLQRAVRTAERKLK